MRQEKGKLQSLIFDKLTPVEKLIGGEDGRLKRIAQARAALFNTNPEGLNNAALKLFEVNPIIGEAPLPFTTQLVKRIAALCSPSTESGQLPAFTQGNSPLDFRLTIPFDAGKATKAITVAQGHISEIRESHAGGYLSTGLETRDNRTTKILHSAFNKNGELGMQTTISTKTPGEIEREYWSSTAETQQLTFNKNRLTPEDLELICQPMRLDLEKTSNPIINRIKTAIILNASPPEQLAREVTSRVELPEELQHLLTPKVGTPKTPINQQDLVELISELKSSTCTTSVESGGKLVKVFIDGSTYHFVEGFLSSGKIVKPSHVQSFDITMKDNVPVKVVTESQSRGAREVVTLQLGRGPIKTEEAVIMIKKQSYRGSGKGVPQTPQYYALSLNKLLQDPQAFSTVIGGSETALNKLVKTWESSGGVYAYESCSSLSDQPLA